MPYIYFFKDIYGVKVLLATTYLSYSGYYSLYYIVAYSTYIHQYVFFN